MPLQITVIPSDVFDRLQEEWNDLLDRSACDSVFLRWEWIHTWWTIFQKNRRLFILTVRNESRLVGIAPFYIDTVGFLGLRVLKLCSDDLSPDYLDIIAEKGQEAEVAQALVNTLTQGASAWDFISFDNLRAESSLLSALSLFAGYHHAVRVSHQCPYVEIKGAFEDYYKTRSRLSSFSLPKKLKVLSQEKNVTHKVIVDEPGFSKGLDDLFSLHEKRADEKYIQSNFLSPEVKRFHHEAGRYFLKEHILNLQLLYQGETPISAFYGFTYKNKVRVYQTGFDPEWRKLSVGGVLWYLGIQKAFQDGIEEFDFLKGTESYKSLWAGEIHSEMELTVYNKTLRGFGWQLTSQLAAVFRNWKRVLSRNAGR